MGRLLGPAQQRLLRRQVLLADNNVRDLQKKKNQSVLLEYLGNYDWVQIGTTLKLTDIVDYVMIRRKKFFWAFRYSKLSISTSKATLSEMCTEIHSRAAAFGVQQKKGHISFMAAISSAMRAVTMLLP